MQNDAITELVGNFGKQLAIAFETNSEAELVRQWLERAPNFRENLFSADQGAYWRTSAEGRTPILSISAVREAEERCPPPPDFPDYR